MHLINNVSVSVQTKQRQNNDMNNKETGETQLFILSRHLMAAREKIKIKS